MAARSRQPLDINTASAEEIERACGIDGVLAQRIIDYREARGPFGTREDLDAVPGFAEVRTDQVLSVVDLPTRDARHQSGRRARRGNTGKTDTRKEQSRSGSEDRRSAADDGASEQRATRGRSSTRASSSTTRTAAGEGSRNGSTSARSVARGSARGQSGAERSSGRSRRSAEPTTDHEFIRRWVEERAGWPACVKGTGRSRGDTGMIRIDFPGFSGSESLERIDWDEWFRQFDENELALLHRDMQHGDGELDRFNKLVKRKSGSRR